MAQADAALKVENLTKKYGRRQVLTGISFTIPTGIFLTLIGPNGVGKTTLIKILCSITRPTNGSVFLNGLSIEKNGRKARKEIGVLSHNTFLYKDLTAAENLRFYGKIYGLSDIDNKIDEALTMVELDFRKNDRVKTFSRGMEQRLGIARALLHNPSIIFLDEPYSGLDPHAAEILDKIIEVLKVQGKTFLMTTHDLDKALEFSDRVIALTSKGIALNEETANLTTEILAGIYKKEGN
jgi:heme exporter protein A